ncbi:MAG TPA: hypothetical protein VFY29_07535 [Terriglobia bacterium]|nr:hypothetical protein [Terriglobia bacterium]
MKTKIGMALLGFALSVAAVSLYAADESPIAGMWATDAVANVEIPKSKGLFASIAGSALNGGNSGSSIGNTNEPVRTIRAEGLNDEEPAITLEFKVDSKGKLSGKVSEITRVEIKDLKMEEGTVTDGGKKFEFRTNEKTEKIVNTIRWVGELTDERTVTLNRLTKGGNQIDGKPIVFHRAKK